MYEYADKVIRRLNRKYLRLFSQIKTLPFDELNIVGEIADLYRKISLIAETAYLDITRHAYVAAMSMAKDAGFEVKTPTLDNVPIDEDWVFDYLIEVDPVTLYVFNNEVERKKQRLMEALAATPSKVKEIEKALRLWVLQSTHYAIALTDDATLKAYKDAGVTKVRWITQKDEKVCQVCQDRNGKVYDIDNAPYKAHYNCRCYYVIAR